MATLIHGPGCATAVPDLHLPVIVVCRNCEYIRDRGGDHHSAQRSNQKYSFHFQLPHSFILLSFAMARAVDFAVPLRSYTLVPLLDQCFSEPFLPAFPFVGRSKLGLKLVPLRGSIDKAASILPRYGLWFAIWRLTQTPYKICIRAIGVIRGCLVLLA